MKITKTLSLIIILTFIGLHSISAKEHLVEEKSTIISSGSLTGMNLSDMGGISVVEFMNLSPAIIKARTGKRMKIKDRLALKLTQRALQKQLDRGEQADFEEANYNFSLGGFLLGFFLGLLGVLIALIAFPRDVFRSSLVGLLCFILVLLLGIFII